MHIPVGFVWMVSPLQSLAYSLDSTYRIFHHVLPAVLHGMVHQSELLVLLHSGSYVLSDVARWILTLPGRHSNRLIRALYDSGV